MRSFDRRTIERGFPGIVLMENAGRQFVDVLAEKGLVGPNRLFAVVCGKGNNGGDGFVIARHLAVRGCRVDVYPTSSPDAMSDDARVNWAILTEMHCDRLRLAQPGDAGTSTLEPPRVVVDALFGTGWKGPLGASAASLIAWINALNAPVVSVDIPSGLDALTGRIDGDAVVARLTISMGLAKPGLFVGKGHDLAGEVVVADLGVPKEWFVAPADAIFRYEENDALDVLPVRPWTAHKYSAGKVLVVAGSRAFTGAPCLTAEASLLAGAGAVVLAAPASTHAVLSTKLTEVIIEPMPETADGTLAARSMERLEQRLAWADAVAVGPGLGRSSETDAFVRTLLSSCPKPMVIDADGLNAFASGKFPGREKPTILTPHTGELGRLLGMDAEAIDRDRIGAARSAAKQLGAVVVLKGAPTATGVRDGRVVLNSSGNPGMATIGAGDVLTGLVVGLLAQGMHEDDAAACGVYVHGKAGDFAAKRLGYRGVKASDILRAIPEVLHMLEG